MISIFKKLRNREIKGSRYIKYAIGEIILVVVGILIALQINTWNDARKNRIKERAFRADIHKEFVRNKEQLEYVTSWNQEHFAFSTKLLSLFPIDTEKDDLDTLSLYIRSSLGNWTFEPVQGRINWLVNNEAFDLIEDPELQEVLLAWEPTYNDYHEDEQAALTFNYEHLYPYLNSELSWGLNLNDPRIRLDELETLRFENMMRARHSRLRGILENPTEELQRLEALIDDIIRLTQTN